MKSSLFRLLPAFLFLIVAAMAIFQKQDYVEAAIWSSFALAVLVPAIGGNSEKGATWQRLAGMGLLILGIILLILRLTGVLPVPVRPIP
jgi:hypothetical protein